MPLLRILALALLLAACGPRWIAVAPGTPPVECAAARLAARGWVVDTAYTDSTRLRVVMIEEGGISVDTVTAELQDPPPGGSYVKRESRWWYGEGPDHRYRGAVL
ncbi:MAG TPA: hypothetical protein VK358_10655, partial [Longimicrobium sp.]|nr:hypothetical protein [Longimicrobium sp.]